MSTNSDASQLGSGCDRSAIDITWSCAAVILACVWKAVHPNVPPPDSDSRGSKRAFVLRRLYMTLWTILLPEVVVLRAATQWHETRRIAEAYKKQHPEDSIDIPLNTGARSSKDVAQPKYRSDESRNRPQWTNTHSFFLSMGGFVTIQSDGKRRTIRPEDLGVVVAEDSMETAPKLPWPMVEEDDIKEKRQGDTITKALVVWQTTWFVLQIIARGVEGLAVTELEIMTLAYGLLSAFLYGLWWNKPYDVQTPILVQAQLEEVDLHDSTPAREPLKVADFLHGIWIAQLDTIIFEGRFFHSDIPLFDGMVSAIFLITSATLFGAIHCIAWNFEFLTHIERLLWISSSLVVAATPCILTAGTIFTALVSPVLERFLHRVCFIAFTKGGDFIHHVALCVYCLARIILIVQPFVLLRDLSPSATQSISWTRFIPHV
ncbi:hypothetical protein PC9H_006381 [Pleurotus ostreatus]|uniref:Uncharacterized protein n=1 Tax=Pleurotus ostreatus TaxID=5322 RepID=A0A8H6ZXI0_PLEOS|nr:uncharacterized protein PC9H_006381 [Pleurotus ostreatus]KAF7430672.1 hypothetical protein PC9H_006381 [Pleurotus ostreatus]